MKKAVSIVAAVLLLLGIVSGCTKNPVASEPTLSEPSTGNVEPDYSNSTVVLYTANVRGNVEVYPQIAAEKAAYEEKGATVYLVDAGNYLQGTAAANADRGLTVYNLMDAAGYDVAAMGMHEFVYGAATTGYAYHGNLHKYYTQAELYRGAQALEYRVNSPRAEEAVTDTRAAKEAAEFAVVCSNLSVDAQASGYYAFEPNIVLGEGLKVGFVCTVDEAVSSFVQDDFLSGYAFCAVSQPECDVLVALGGGSGDIVIDAPAGGELTAGAYIIDNSTKAVAAVPIGLHGSDAEVEAMVKAIEPAAIVCTSGVTLNGSDSANRNAETNLGDLTADALLWYAENKLRDLQGVPIVAIQNGGNCDNFLYAGEVTDTDLLCALPFSPMGIGVVYVTGSELLETLESATQSKNCPGWAQVSGMEYTVDTAKPYDAGEAYGDWFKAATCNRVTITSVGGAAFDPDATYAVIADNFILGGNDTYYTFGAIKESGARYMQVSTFGGLKTRDIVAMYISEALGGTIGDAYAAPQGRITVIG